MGVVGVEAGEGEDVVFCCWVGVWGCACECHGFWGMVDGFEVVDFLRVGGRKGVEEIQL